MGVSKENKEIAKTVLQAFGGAPKVTKYWDDNHVSSIDLVACEDQPCEGVTSYSTLGLSDHSINYEVDEIPLRVEIVGACASEYEWFPNIMATSAFCIINSNDSCSPGAIFRDVVSMYDPGLEMKHVLFVPPFLWEDSLHTLEFPKKTVAWLLAVPISEKEYLFAEQHGTDKLEELFEEKEIDVFDLERKSVL